MFRTVRSAALALACVAGVFAPAAASAEQVEAEHYVDDFSNEVPAHDPDYCPDLDFAVVDAGHSEGFFHGVRRGDGLVYFSDRFTFEGTVTNLSNGKTLHVTAHASSMDVHVVDNGDGTLTITWRFVGTVVNEFPTVTFRDSGQIMGQDLIDNAGTPGDPDDDEFIDFLGILKEVGHHDTSDRDYCADLAEFLG